MNNLTPTRRRRKAGTDLPPLFKSVPAPPNPLPVPKIYKTSWLLELYDSYHRSRITEVASRGVEGNDRLGASLLGSSRGGLARGRQRSQSHTLRLLERQGQVRTALPA